jgi:uncharacterized Zn finger protein
MSSAQRKAVENLSDLLTNDELGQLGKELPHATERIE